MKKSKVETKYRDGSPKNLCGYCVYYRGGACSLVEGKISPYKICNLYKPYKNPLHGTYSIVKRATATASDDWAS